ncbi:MAG: cohesin domain-containing protein [Oscillospiraceae bacterium]
MKNLKKILMCLSLVCCLSLGVACGNNNGDGEEAQDNSSVDNVAENNNSNNGDDSQGDTVEVTDEEGNVIEVTTIADGNSSDSDNSAYVTDVDGSIVTDANGNAFVTEAVTDSQGATVTDDSGNVVTQKVAVTTKTSNVNNGNDANASTTVANDSSNNNATTTVADGNSNANNNNTTTVADGNSNANNNQTTNANGQQTNVVLTVTEMNNTTTVNNNNANVTTTVADTGLYFAKNRYSTFIWMADDAKNRYGSDAFAEITFKAFENAKTGTYPIEISYIDVYDENCDMVNFTAMNGTITVGDENSVVAQGPASSGPVIRLDNGNVKPGDTVKIKIYFDNNPGVAVFQMDIKYDNNALEVQSINPAGMFANDSIDSNLNINIASN